MNSEDILLRRIEKLEKQIKNLQTSSAPTLPIYDSTNFPQDAVQGQYVIDQNNNMWVFGIDNIWHEIGGSAGQITQIFWSPFFGDNIEITDQGSKDYLLWGQNEFGPIFGLDGNGAIYASIADSPEQSYYRIKVVIDLEDDPNNPGDGTQPTDPKYWDLSVGIAYGSPDFTPPPSSAFGGLAAENRNTPFQAPYTIQTPNMDHGSPWTGGTYLGNHRSMYREITANIVNTGDDPYVAFMITLAQSHPNSDSANRQTFINDGYVELTLIGTGF